MSDAQCAVLIWKEEYTAAKDDNSLKDEHESQPQNVGYG